MENLWLFKNLTKLQMDNNIIERIEGLDTLEKLTWLGNQQSLSEDDTFDVFRSLVQQHHTHRRSGFVEGLDGSVPVQ